MSTHPDKGDDGNVAMVDWRGRPAKGRQLGGPKSSFILLGAVICGYCAFGGIYFNLVLYLKEVLHEDSATAANDLTNLIGTVYFTCILGAFLADAYWGRIPTLMVSLLVFTVGCVLSSLAITIQQNNLPTGSLPHNLRLFLFVSLSIAAVGCGSFQPVIVSLGGDQFDEPKKKARFFSWVFVASNIGLILGLTVITYLENSGKWWLGFWISSAAAAVSVPLLVIGIPTWRQTRPGGNPLLRILQVVVCAAWKCKVTVPTNAESLYEVTDEKSAILGNRKISHTDTFRWLDKAATRTGQEVEGGNPWRLCTVTQVEETKCVARIFPVVLTGVMYNVAAAQLFTLFVEQGGVMDTKVSGAAGSFHIPPGSMRLALNVAGITVPPLYEYAVVPRLRARTGHAKGLTPLQRMGCGLVTAAIAMAVAALVEMKRLRSLPNKLSILWLTPQFFIFGISNMFAVVAQMDFFYTEISDSMRSLGSSLFLVCMGLGNYVSTLLVIVVTSVSSRYLGCNWIPRNLNLGHLDYFYWLVLVLLMLTTFLFLLYASSYTYLSLAPPARPPSSSPPRDHISPLLVITAQTTFAPLISTTSSAPQNHSPQSPASSSPPPASDPLTITSLHRQATRPA